MSVVDHGTRAACLCLLVASPAGAQDWTERDAIERFLQVSPVVLEARERAAGVLAEARVRAQAPNPSVSYRHEGAGASDFIEAEQLLPLNGRLGLLHDAAGAAGLAAQADADAQVWALRTELRLTFERALAAQEREAVIGESIVRLDTMLAILRRREQEGEGSKFDRLRADRERAEARADLVAAGIDSRRALGELRALYPETVAVATRLARSPLPAIPDTSLEALTGRALEARADYRAELHRVQHFAFEKEAATRLRVPEAAVVAGTQRADAGAGSQWGAVFGLTVTLPLFAAGEPEAALARSAAGAARFRQEALRRRIAEEVSASLDVARRADQSRADFDRDARALGIELVSIAGVAYQEGEIGILELLDAWRMDRQSRLRAIDLVSALRVAQIALDDAVGEEVVP